VQIGGHRLGDELFEDGIECSDKGEWIEAELRRYRLPDACLDDRHRKLFEGTVMWRGVSRLINMKLGVTLGAELVGN